MSSSDTAKKPVAKILDVAGTAVEVVECPNGLTAMTFAVTNQLYEALMDRETPAAVKMGEVELLAAVGGMEPGSQFRDFPVTNVSWFDAAELANKLSEAEGLEPAYILHRDEEGNIVSAEVIEGSNGWRLPTVEEWQELAAAGQNYKYPGSDNPDEVAWHSGNSGNEIHTVGELKPNAWGLYDTAGNCWEWTNSTSE